MNLINDAIASKVKMDSVDCILDPILRYTGVNKSQLSDPACVQKVLDAIERLDSFGSVIQYDEEKPGLVENEHAKNLLKMIITGHPISTDAFDRTVIKALFVTKDEKILREARDEMQNFLNRLGVALKREEHSNPHDQKQAEVLIGNILAIYPFFEPEHHSQLTIPQKINSEWVMVNYQADLLPMTPSWKGDPYYAVGLEPLDNPDAMPLLLFMGTPPSTTRGVSHAEFTDFIPSFTPGETLFNEGQQVIKEWVDDKTKMGKVVHLFGQSLGGTLALIMTVHLPEKIGKVYAYNPPSLKDSLLKLYNENPKAHDVNIYCQENDPIYPIGDGWSPSWNVYYVLPQAAHNPYIAHLLAFTGQKKVVILKLTAEDIAAHNNSTHRRMYNVAAELLKVPFFMVKGTSMAVQIVKHNFITK